MKTPSSRSLDLLRRHGYEAQIAEYYVPWARVRKDLFGFIDIAALSKWVGDKGVLGVQTTTASHMKERLNKINSLSAARLWLSTGNLIHIHGWKKEKEQPRSKKVIWRPLVWALTYESEKNLRVEDITYLWT